MNKNTLNKRNLLKNISILIVILQFFCLNIFAICFQNTNNLILIKNFNNNKIAFFQKYINNKNYQKLNKTQAKNNYLNAKNIELSSAIYNGVSAKSESGKDLTNAKSMLTIEANSGRILYTKNENERLPMASTTKIITAIVAIENCKNLDKKEKIPEMAVGVEGSSIYLRKNEHLSVRELLYGLMLRSGNDSAVAIATIISGSVENFVKLMNDFCRALGCENTNIVTVNGLHDDNHYTSAKDLAKITCYALKNEIFRNIVMTKNAIISDENAKNGIRNLKNKNKLLWKVDGATGVKTGYTRKAGRCFVGSAKRNGMEIVCVLIDCPLMFEDCTRLIEKAFDEYQMTKIFEKGKVADARVSSRKKEKTVPVFLTEDIYYPLLKKNTSSDFSKIKASIIINDNLKLPLSYSDEIGKLEIKFENDLIFSQKLFTINAEDKKEESFIKKIIKAF